MLDQLTQRLSGLVASLRGKGRITDDDVAAAMREVRLALLEADVALPVVKDLVERVRARAVGTELARSLTPGQALVKLVHDELVATLAAGDPALELRVVPPAVILLAGLQGAGKTTTAGKLAKHLIEKQRKRVLLVSTDVRRPAAIEQLERLAAQVGARSLRPAAADPVAIARAALDDARVSGIEVLIVDTAGRLHVDAELMDEARRIHAAVAPIETLFVVDAMAGQDAATAAKAFGAALPLTGVILTKADGDARGGAALSVARLTGKPIKFLGIGEKLDGLEAFDPARLAGRILGMGDVVALVERVQSQADPAKAAALAEKVRSGEGFDLTDFRDQLRQMLAMGGLGALMEHLPGGGQLPAGARAMADDKVLKRQAAIVDSMTPQERRRPAVINGSRRRRIAAGAGVQVQDVNRLLKQFDEMQRVMKKLKGGGMKGLMRSLGGRLPGLLPPKR
jgi:signal recognition particle subunit SRP54